MTYPETVLDTVLNRARLIQLVIFDVDGVLTDGRLYFNDAGEETKAFYARDGLGMRLLMDHGIKTAILTGRQSELVLHRARNLQMDLSLVYQGYRDKRPAFKQLLQQTGLQPEQIAYVGDDIVDLPVMAQVGLAIAVQDAHPMVKQHSHWVTEHQGGKGAVRDACELILSAQGHLDAIVARYLTY
ncbi:3-deoxy-manno-octulosonate-8-phosphatase KdsC [Thiofilum flexile]|uniref:3-deoxy-manno-octulosonate-8-phosphatase KdsC n=1 Tax=Thiofilum flexile TaxID=125627 RepID=UPI0003782DA8|nr:3-deoxy-manno-octulosonate-8-phosphatase KdsC [Thiofilum flexile]